MGKKLTEEDYEEISERYVDGDDTLEIANDFGITQRHVYKVLEIVGTPRDRRTNVYISDDMWKEMEQRYIDGELGTDLAEEFGIYRSRFYKHMSEKGIQKKQVLDVHEKTRILDLFESGMTAYEIGERLGIRPSIVQNVIIKAWEFTEDVEKRASDIHDGKGNVILYYPAEEEDLTMLDIEVTDLSLGYGYTFTDSLELAFMLGSHVYRAKIHFPRNVPSMSLSDTLGDFESYKGLFRKVDDDKYVGDNFEYTEDELFNRYYHEARGLARDLSATAPLWRYRNRYVLFTPALIKEFEKLD